ncbi:ribosome small subunit-dependent GTPase A [Shouchella shacheensis]|uniref:ribosome small subunit-dependent GTPase A n=1 Tax=Shouchella shacheensis TaxID=1649580 RepID=UPI00074044DF|nr:ribosome small subunit-dependent GTPase A [Shouchella shacheensis]
MAKGMIVKALAGFYYVQDGDEVVQCRARGVFRKRKITPLVGDHVTYEAENSTDGYIMELEERKNQLVRPPVANVDQAILVFSAREPLFSGLLLDRFLVHIEANEIEPLIIISKTDLLTSTEREALKLEAETYEKIGYQVLYTSTEQMDDPLALLPNLKNKVSVVAGQSGVGKSSLLNAIAPSLTIETNEISNSLGRGKHTTRHVELLQIHNGLIADTPGFSSLEFMDMEAIELRDCFPEFLSRVNECKFRGCLHVVEPGCAVIEALDAGEIAEGRYQHYKQFLSEIQSQKRRY